MLKFNHVVVLALSTVIPLGVTAGALAGVPAITSYQGKLLSGDGKPVTDGSYSVIFALYA